MGLAEELLNSIPEDVQMDVLDDPHIIIDEDRNILLPERYRNIAAEGDHNVVTYTFDCPRYSDGRDMSEMVIYINYIRSDGAAGSYPADNVTIDAENPDLMHFDWTLLSPATIAKGKLAFLVCARKTDDEGNRVNHWSSRICESANVTEGMDCHQETIIDLYPDIITRILERLTVLENGGTNSVQYTVQDLEEEQKLQARKNIGAADATEVSKLSEEIATKASAIKEKASGEVIVVTDSAEAKPLGLTIDGKSEQTQYSGNNLLNIGSLHLLTNAEGKVVEELTYVSSIIDVKGFENIYISGDFTLLNSNTLRIGKFLEYPSIDTQGVRISIRENGIIEVSDCDYVLLSFLRIDTGTTESDIEELNNSFMINKGSTALLYEPYVGGQPSPSPSYPQEIRNAGAIRNYLPNNGISKTVNGITYTVNENGSVTMNGTATNESNFPIYGENWNDVSNPLKFNPNETYILSQGTDNAIVYCRDGINNENFYTALWSSKSINPKCITYAFIQVPAGKTCNNETIYPMIRSASIVDDTYYPYTGKYVVGVNGTGKNLAKLPDVSEKEVGGVKLSCKDGIITVDGTSTGTVNSSVAKINYILPKGLKGTFIISGGEFTKMAMYVSIEKADGSRKYIANNTFVLDGTEKSVSLYGNMNADTTVSNYVIYAMIRYAEITDDTYEPYKENRTEVYLDEPLRAGDIICQKDGVWGVERHRAVEVFDGSDDEGWFAPTTSNGTAYRVATNILKDKIYYLYNSTVFIGFCDSYVGVTALNTYNCIDGISVDNTGGMRIYDANFNTSNIALWKAHLHDNPITVEYELATPTFTPFEDQTIFDNMTTFYPTTVLSNDEDTNMEIEYVADTKMYIDKKFAELAQALV